MAFAIKETILRGTEWNARDGETGAEGADAHLKYL